MIRVHQAGNGRIEGQFANGSGSTLVLTGTSGPREFSTISLDSLWVRGTSAKRGAIIGGIAGVSAGVAFGVFANEVGCKDDSGDPCPEAIPLMGLAGAAAGALVGALIGSAFPHWHRRVP